VLGKSPSIIYIYIYIYYIGEENSGEKRRIPSVAAPRKLLKSHSKVFIRLNAVKRNGRRNNMYTFILFHARYSFVRDNGKR